MRLVLAIIQPTKLKAVQEALARIGVERMTVADAHSFGQQPGRGSGAKEARLSGADRLGRLVALEIAVNEDFLERTLDTLCQTAKTGIGGVLGGGQVFVLPVEECLRLSDGARGPEAIS